MSSTHQVMVRDSALKGLNERQTLWVLDYVRHFNGTEAARNAGYKNPTVAAQRMYKDRRVQRALKRLLGKFFKEKELTTQRILDETAMCALRDARDMFDERGVLLPPDKMPEQITRCIDGVKVKHSFDPDGNIAGQIVEYRLVSKASMMELLWKQHEYIKELMEGQDQRVNFDHLFDRHPEAPEVLTVESRETE